MVDLVWKTLKPSPSQYNHFKLIGRFNLPENYGDPDFELKSGLLIKLLSKDLFEEINGLTGDYVVTRPTRDHLDISVRKMDLAPCYDFLNHWCYPIALQYWDHMWSDAMSVDEMSPTEIMNSMKMEKSPGFLLTQNGFRTKGDYLGRGGFFQILDPAIMDEIPLWKAVGKVEKKHRSLYVGESKMRTFIIEPTELVYHHKRVYGMQNQAMKLCAWSAYGLNPFEGGVHAMARNLNRFRYKFMLDGKLWDRKASWMKVAYDLRDKYTKDDIFKNYIRKNVIFSYVVLPNGDLIYKEWGNNSGSATTTGDNILGMSLIIWCALVLLSEGNKQFLSHIDDYFCCYLFGDDVVGSFEIPGKTQEQFEESIRLAFKLFGVELDPYISSVNLEDMSFLGFHFKDMSDLGFGWVPRYPIDVLSKSFLYTIDKIERDGEINKLLTVTLMSAGNGEHIYNMFREALIEVIVKVNCELTRQLLKYGIPTYRDTLAWYAGYEKSSEFFKFLSDSEILLSVGGGTKDNEF